MENTLLYIYHALLAHYGDPGWWPAQSPYEVMVGAVLTQNTAWSNVEKAIANLGDDLAPENLAAMPIHDLMARIRPAGSFTQKAATLKAMTAWYGNYGYDVATVRLEPLSALRKALLHIQGIGPETGDAILLYAFGLPTFVADAYTLRLLSRYPLPMGKTYGEVKSAFEEGLPQDAAIYNRYHALIVINGKYHCKKKPACGGCPLAYSCGKVGLSSLP